MPILLARAAKENQEVLRPLSQEELDPKEWVADLQAARQQADGGHQQPPLPEGGPPLTAPEW